MKKLYPILFITGVFIFANSCQKSSDNSLVSDKQTTQSNKTFIEVIESGIDPATFSSESIKNAPTNNLKSSGSAGLTFFSDPALFAASCPGLPTEDFEEAIAEGFGQEFLPPLNETTDNGIFSPGDILPGVSITVPNELGILNPNEITDNLSKSLLDNFADKMSINFTAGDVQAVSMLVQLYFLPGDVEIEIFGTSGLLGTTTVFGTGAGTFFGLMSDEPITLITLEATFKFEARGYEAIDDLSFGSCVIDSDGDGCPDNTDPHPNSIQVPTIVIDGCDSEVANVFVTGCSTMSDFISDMAASSSNHGEFVSSVAQLTKEWKANGLISGKEKGAIQSCASGANIP